MLEMFICFITQLACFIMSEPSGGTDNRLRKELTITCNSITILHPRENTLFSANLIRLPGDNEHELSSVSAHRPAQPVQLGSCSWLLCLTISVLQCLENKTTRQNVLETDFNTKNSSTTKHTKSTGVLVRF